MKTNRIGLVLAAMLIVAPATAFAGNATWNTDNSGNWTTPGNWTAGGPPNGAGQTAGLTFDITADRVVTLDSSQTISGMTIGDPTSGYFAYTLSGANALVISGNSTINKPTVGNTAHDTIAVPLTLQGNLTLDSKATGGLLEISGSIGQDATNRSLTVTGSNANSLTSAAVIILSGANTYAGGTTVTNAGSSTNTGAVLRVMNNAGLGTGNVTLVGGNNTARLELAGGVTVSNNVTSISGADTLVETNPRLAGFSGNNTWAGSITGFGTGGNNYPIASLGTGVGDFFTVSGNINYNRNDTTRSLRFGGDGNGAVTGAISETNSTAAININKDGGGTWTFSGANTYKGITTVNHGTLQVSSLNSVATPSASSSLGRPTTVAAGTINLGFATSDDSTFYEGTLDYTGAGETTDRVVNLSGDARITANGTGPLVFTSNFTADRVRDSAKVLTLGGSSTAANTISGAIVNGSGNKTTILDKVDSGTWILSGANTYTGNTFVDQGTLLVTGTHTGGDTYFVGIDGTLGGNGTISAGVEVDSGTVSPGTSPGTLTVGALTLTGDVTGAYDLDTPSSILDDLLSVTGNLDLSSLTGLTLNVTKIGGGFLADGSYALIQYAGSITPPGGSVAFTYNGPLNTNQSAEITYGLGVVNLTLMTVPEPSTFVLAGLGVVGLGFVRLRKGRWNAR